MSTMRAVSFQTFGGPEVLEIVEVERPEPLPTEVLVEVRAAGDNPVDWKTRAGARIPGTLGQPPRRMGWDVSEVVAATGLGVTRFKVGDEVCGMPWFPRPAGTYALGTVTCACEWPRCLSLKRQSKHIASRRKVERMERSSFTSRGDFGRDLCALLDRRTVVTG